MRHVTVGKKYNQGKIAKVECIKNAQLDDLDIKGKYFLLIVLNYGKLEFSVGDKKIKAAAPSFICFDETENPVLLSKTRARYTCIYFHPTFLNMNMTFKLLRSAKYGDIATTHDMFMLKPFTDKPYVIPIAQTQAEKIENAADYMLEELRDQRDFYWSCRGRAHFMEVIIALERMYGLLGYGYEGNKSDYIPIIQNPKLREAVLYLEAHYSEDLTLPKISANVGINHTTLNYLMKQELGCTAVEYLTNYRITMSKKQLAFTDVPIKDVANMVGFKTVQHFNRIFKEITGNTPADFRKTSVQKRREEIK